MDKAKTLTTTAAFLVGTAFGATALDDIGAKDIDRRVNMQKLVTDESADAILQVIKKEFCPEYKEKHGAHCDPYEILEKGRFDRPMINGVKRMRVFPGFFLSGKFKAE